MKRTPLRRKTPLRSRSTKQASHAKVRFSFVHEQLSRRPLCEVCPIVLSCFDHPVVTRRIIPLPHCTRIATELHEPWKRSQGGPTDVVANSFASCRAGNEYVEAQPAVCKLLGLCVESHGLVPAVAFDIITKHWARIGVEYQVFERDEFLCATTAGMSIRHFIGG